MIHIFHFETRKGGLIEIKGHAKSSQFGKDVVCAGVSAITTTLAILLMNENMNSKVESGNTRIEYTHSDRIAPYVAFAMTGYRWMAEVFPEFVALKEEKKE